MPEYTNYNVKEGKHDFKPNNYPLFINSKTKCEFRFRLDKSMWYPINHPSYPYGGYDGWNKLGFGITKGCFSKAKKSVMVAEFPHQGFEYHHHIALYINDRKGAWQAKDIMVVKADVDYEGLLTWEGNLATLFLKDLSNPRDTNTVTLQLKRSGLMPARAIGAWHGGKYPAHQYRSFKAYSKYLK